MLTGGVTFSSISSLCSSNNSGSGSGGLDINEDGEYMCLYLYPQAVWESVAYTQPKGPNRANVGDRHRGLLS